MKAQATSDAAMSLKTGCLGASSTNLATGSSRLASKNGAVTGTFPRTIGARWMNEGSGDETARPRSREGHIRRWGGAGREWRPADCACRSAPRSSTTGAHIRPRGCVRSGEGEGLASSFGENVEGALGFGVPPPVERLLAHPARLAMPAMFNPTAPSSAAGASVAASPAWWVRSLRS